MELRNPKEHEIAKNVEPPICSESVAGDTQELTLITRWAVGMSWCHTVQNATPEPSEPGMSILLPP